MAIPGGPSRPPVVALPRSSSGRFAFEKGCRFDASLVATLVLVAAGAVWFVGFALLASPLWWLGLLLWAAAVGVFVFWKSS
jgi:hypothetical protein